MTFIKEPSADRRGISTVIRSNVARLLADHKLSLFRIVYNTCIHFIYEIKSTLDFFIGPFNISFVLDLITLFV